MTTPARVQELLLVLSTKIRLVSPELAARAFWGDGDERILRCRRSLAELVKAGFLKERVVRAHPIYPPDAPLLKWGPGEEEPAFGGLSYKLHVRWGEALRPVKVYMASEKLSRQFGSPRSGLKLTWQATHDLYCAALFLKWLKTDPERANAWMSEDVLAPRMRHRKLPDAELHFPDGRPTVVIEIGGSSYSPDRLRAIHEDCVRRQLAYELW
jgi:hypothetical protein